MNRDVETNTDIEMTLWMVRLEERIKKLEHWVAALMIHNCEGGAKDPDIWPDFWAPFEEEHK